MDKSYSYSRESTDTTTATISSSSSIRNKDQYLKHLNKISHKISKPPLRNPPSFNPLHHRPQLPTVAPPQGHQNQQPQPPVYNVEKSEFRDVVQKLTGAPAAERLSNPRPINPPKPPSSRLQRIRPPPLAQVSNLPPPLLNDVTVNPSNHTTTNTTNGGLVRNQRQVQPLSPLPPFPAVHAAAESPISAYMRYLQSSTHTLDSDPMRLLGFSPRSPCNLSSPSFRFSSANQLGFLQFPLSPTLPVPSPMGKGH